MEQKKFGYLLLGVTVLMLVIVYLFNQALHDIVTASCSVAGHESCPMTETINQQTYVSFVIVGLVLCIALYLIVSKPEKEIVVKTKTIKQKAARKAYDTTGLRPDERRVFELVKHKRGIFQADIIENTEFGKAKVTRILDRLEGNGLIERRRRGMTNMVLLKE